MRIQEMIDQLEKLKDEYPEHEVTVRRGGIIDRIEVGINVVEVVEDGAQPPFASHNFKLCWE